MRSGCKCGCLSRKSRLHLHLTLVWFLQIHHKYVNAEIFPLNPHEFQFRFRLVLVLVLGWVLVPVLGWILVPELDPQLDPVLVCFLLTGTGTNNSNWPNQLTTQHWVLTHSRYCRIHLCICGHLLGTSVCISSLFAVKNLFFCMQVLFLKKVSFFCLGHVEHSRLPS